MNWNSSHMKIVGETEKNMHDVQHVVHQLETRFTLADVQKSDRGEKKLEERRKNWKGKSDLFKKYRIFQQLVHGLSVSLPLLVMSFRPWVLTLTWGAFFKFEVWGFKNKWITTIVVMAVDSRRHLCVKRTLHENVFAVSSVYWVTFEQDISASL